MLIGRERELEAMVSRISTAASGKGGVLLLAGEAGIGKSALIDCGVAASGAAVSRGNAAMHGVAPWGPIVAALRDHERRVPGTLRDSGPLAAHLAGILPEIGETPSSPDDASVLEALKDACCALAANGPALMILEDLQWADEATLELLPLLAHALSTSRLLIIASYRREEIHRGHRLRRTRAELRRARCLEELSLEALTPAETTALIERIIGCEAGARLRTVVQERTEGLPFFIEEITGAMLTGGHLTAERNGLELSKGEVPVPETVRDAVRIRADRLSPEARAAIEFAAVAGQNDLGRFFDEDLHPLEEALQLGIIVDRNDTLSFRHDLIREGIYADIPWTRRRSLHRRAAERLEKVGAEPHAIAEQWLGARENDSARLHFIDAARRFCSAAAHADAAAAGRRALDLWPVQADEILRGEVLEQLGGCAELSGDLAGAARAWEEIRDARSTMSEDERRGEIARRLAGLYEMQGMPERTRTAREEAATAFERSGHFADAIAERLSIAERLELAGSGSAAVAMVEGLAAMIDRAGSGDLRVRALALEGELRAKLGDRERGLALSKEALRLALEAEEPSSTAEAYYRLGAALENACDHEGAIAAYTTARGYCLGKKIDGLAQVCFACMLPAVLLTGQWSRTVEVCRGVLGSPHSPPVAQMKAKLHLGLVAVLRGHAKRSQRLFEETYAFSQQNELVPIEVFSTWGLMRAAELQGADEEAAERGRELLRRTADRDEQHYVVPVLRWASTFFGRRGDLPRVTECTALLSKIATASGHPEYLGPMAHALGELALLNEDPSAASAHFEQALRLMAEAGIVYERAETQLRTARALAGAERRDEALEHLTLCYRTARKLGARPLAQKVSDTMQALGAPVERRLGRKAAAAVDGAGLSGREADVLRLAADGFTNKQIGACLFISKRTVDMHMRNVLSRLGCSSRVEAVGRARTLRILP